MARKFEKVGVFEVKGLGVGSVRVAETGEVRLELPGRYEMESFFPGEQTRDKANATFVPREKYED